VIIAVLLSLLLIPPPAWKEFSDWFSREGTPGAPADVLKAYGERMKSTGASDAEARVAEVREYMNAHPKEALTLHFDRIYTWDKAPFTREPSRLVVKVASARKPGKALDIAMGQGRNALWLAKNGWQVSGYDLSPEAIRQAREAAVSAGMTLDLRVASHEEYPLGEAQWDLIVMSFAFTRLSDAAYMKAVRDSLKPGGVLLVEGFNGGPKPETNMILKAFLEYRVLLFEDLPDVADWGKMKAPLLRMALEKP
jgi:ubiquinone/menaquinone biosynthesis C-methylase UbiE